LEVYNQFRDTNIEFDELKEPPCFWGYLSPIVGIFRLTREEKGCRSMNYPKIFI